jgi:hypothetical protein
MTSHYADVDTTNAPLITEQCTGYVHNVLPNGASGWWQSGIVSFLQAVWTPYATIGLNNSYLSSLACSDLRISGLKEPALPTRKLEAFKEQCRNLTPSTVPPDSGLLLTLMEYAQAKQLLEQCFSVPKSLADRKLGGLYLAHLFGAKPMADVLKEIHHRLTGLRAKLDALRKGQGKIHTSHAYTSFCFSSHDEPSWVMTCPNTGNTCKKQFAATVHQSVTFKLHYVVQYSYSIDPKIVDKILSTGGKVLVAFGRLGPKALWDAVPFSWLIDWFLPTIKPTLAKMPSFISPYEAVKLNAHHTALSIKRIGREWVTHNNTCYTAWPEIPVTKWAKEYYRLIGRSSADVLDALIAESKTDYPKSLSQMAILAALLHG